MNLRHAASADATVALECDPPDRTQVALECDPPDRTQVAMECALPRDPPAPLQYLIGYLMKKLVITLKNNQ